ncbi:hypothetical protein [Asanoa iriomotensis]|uniref:Uncharacterized protein n=1 Tax=Asanoa iriomotensis TaxID=234613 RepID=A0ABQ4CC70_9ACTN|nr:hypothetical protein [Asanoa iriomotensis]GIF60364.1 hypothetical protein Air01nite_64590 [Asanoa iriomotensis]
MAPTVRALVALLYATAAATVAVELLNLAYAPDREFGLAVRTGWAVLRAFGFLILVWHVRRGRAGAKPLGLILAVTTVFAVGRLIVPRSGVPPLAGAIGFAVLTALCLAVVVLLYRAPVVGAHLVRHPNRLVIDRRGIGWQESVPRRPPVAGWTLTARVAAFTYPALIAVPALVALGEGGLRRLPFAVAWLAFAVVVGNALLPIAIFLVRDRGWARVALVVVTVVVLAVDLPLCYLLLGLDGLVRDGGPLLVAAAVAVWGVARSRATAGVRLPAPRAEAPIPDTVP